MPGTLYIVATPIGNLSDFSLRAKECLESVDWVLAEDPRQSLKLLNHFEIETKLIPFSDHASESKIETIIENMSEGKSYALVSDAGTPCVSDPGSKLIEKIRQAELDVVPIVGPSAVTALVSVFGKPHTSFHFWGFFPRKDGERKKLIESFEKTPGLHVFFESPHRIEKIFNRFLKDLTGFHMVVGREMTKKFETFYAGSPSTVFEKLMKGSLKGEFCIGLLKDES